MADTARSSKDRGPLPRTPLCTLSVLAGFLLAFPHAATSSVSFAPPGAPIASGVSGSVQAVDVNRDGLLDLLIQSDDGSVKVVMNLGGGKFSPAEVAAPYDGVFNGVAGDFNGDGFPDLVRLHPGGGTAVTTVTILLGDGSGHFHEAPGGVTISSAFIWSLALGDFGGDGRLDVAILSQDSTDLGKYLIQILPGDGAGGLGAPLLTPLPALSGHPAFLAAADLDRDGLTDLILLTEGASMNQSGGVLYSVRNLGGGLFGSPTEVVHLAEKALLADFNRDGIPDILSQYSNYGDSESVALGDGKGGFRNTFSGWVGFFGAPSVLAAGDLDGDGNLDFVAGGAIPDLCTAFLGHGDGTFTRDANVPLGILLLADLDNDGKADIVSGIQGNLYFQRNTTGEGTAVADLVIPAFMASPGAQGAYFSTTLSGTNLGETTAKVDMTFTDADSGQTTSWSASLPPLSQAGASVGPSPDLLSPPFRGTLRIHVSGASSPDAVTFLATTATQDSVGSYGAATPSVAAAETFEGAAWIGWLAETAQDRTNLAVLNAGSATDGDVTLRVTLFTTEPAGQPETVLPDVVLSPGQVYQFNRVLDASGPAPRRGFAGVERVAGQARFFAYAVVNDNQTSDGSYQAATAEGLRTAETRLVVPVLVETPSFASEFVVTNVSDATKTLRLEYVAAAVNAPDETVRFDLVLAGKSQVRWESFVEALRQSGFTSLLPKGPAYSGALFITVADGPVEGVLTGARTATVGSSGRYGLFAPALPLSGAASDSAWLAGLLSDDRTRSNVALVNTGSVDGSSSLFRIDVFGGDSGVLRATLADVSVGAKGWLQLNSLLRSLSPDLISGFVRITKMSGANRFTAYGVNNDGATPGERTGDGSYLPMRVLQQP